MGAKIVLSRVFSPSYLLLQIRPNIQQNIAFPKRKDVGF